jgi:hypothetical protein
VTERRSHPLVVALRELAAVTRQSTERLRELAASVKGTRDGFIESDRATKAELSRLSNAMGDVLTELQETNRLLREREKKDAEHDATDARRERQWKNHEERLVALEVDAATGGG